MVEFCGREMFVIRKNALYFERCKFIILTARNDSEERRTNRNSGLSIYVLR